MCRIWHTHFLKRWDVRSVHVCRGWSDWCQVYGTRLVHGRRRVWICAAAALLQVRTVGGWWHVHDDVVLVLVLVVDDDDVEHGMLRVLQSIS